MKAYISPALEKILHDPVGRQNLRKLWTLQPHETATIECGDGSKYTLKVVPVNGPYENEDKKESFWNKLIKRFKK